MQKTLAFKWQTSSYRHICSAAFSASERTNKTAAGKKKKQKKKRKRVEWEVNLEREMVRKNIQRFREPSERFSGFSPMDNFVNSISWMLSVLKKGVRELGDLKWRWEEITNNIKQKTLTITTTKLELNKINGKFPYRCGSGRTNVNFISSFPVSSTDHVSFISNCAGFNFQDNIKWKYNNSIIIAILVMFLTSSISPLNSTLAISLRPIFVLRNFPSVPRFLSALFRNG